MLVALAYKANTLLLHTRILRQKTFAIVGFASLGKFIIHVDCESVLTLLILLQCRLFFFRLHTARATSAVNLIPSPNTTGMAA